VMKRMKLLNRRRQRQLRTRNWRRSSRRNKRNLARSWWARSKDSYLKKPNSRIRQRKTRHRNSKKSAR
jgi:hypothetical protein